MTEKETTPFTRIPWNEYKEILERFEYDEAQISAVKEVRETAEEITKEQFDFLVSSGIIKKRVKLKKIRSMFIVGDNVVFLSHYHKGWQVVGFFINEENE